MQVTERDRYKLGYSAPFYEDALLEAKTFLERDRLLRQRHIVKAEDMPWEHSRHGRIKHLINERMDYPVHSINLYLMEVPLGSRSGKHRHMAEEIIHILEGRGFDMHWDPEVTITDRYYWKNKETAVRYEYEEGDFVYIPPMVAHQHFNDSSSGVMRFLSATPRVTRYLGYPHIEQLEDAPGFRGGK
jgi:quercetin dioxygenase-like cupin family protein